MTPGNRQRWGYEQGRKYKLLSSRLAVLLCLLHHWNKETLVAFPSIKTIAEETRFQPATVKSSINELRELGLIKWQPKKGKRHGVGKPVNEYSIALPINTNNWYKSDTKSERISTNRQKEFSPIVGKEQGRIEQGTLEHSVSTATGSPPNDGDLIEIDKITELAKELGVRASQALRDYMKYGYEDVFDILENIALYDPEVKHAPALYQKLLNDKHQLKRFNVDY